MAKIADGYYFMFEIGWFIDLLIPSIVRVIDGNIHLIGSKICNDKNVKPCCLPCGGAEEVKKLSPDDASLKAFKSLDSLVPIDNLDDLAGELEKNLEDKKIREKYLNTKTKMQREAMTDRVANDYKVLAGVEL